MTLQTSLSQCYVTLSLLSCCRLPGDLTLSVRFDMLLLLPPVLPSLKPGAWLKFKLYCQSLRSCPFWVSILAVRPDWMCPWTACSKYEQSWYRWARVAWNMFCVWEVLQYVWRQVPSVKCSDSSVLWVSLLWFPIPRFLSSTIAFLLYICETDVRWLKEELNMSVRTYFKNGNEFKNVTMSVLDIHRQISTWCDWKLLIEQRAITIWDITGFLVY